MLYTNKINVLRTSFCLLCELADHAVITDGLSAVAECHKENHIYIVHTVQANFLVICQWTSDVEERQTTFLRNWNAKLPNAEAFLVQKVTLKCSARKTGKKQNIWENRFVTV